MKKSPPLISIIVPIYNVEAYLKQCLDSLVEQTLHDIEIICVNDGSPDNSLEILNKYSENDERVIILNQENTGVSSARNAGLKKAKGDYIMFVDSDDWIDENTCSEMLKAIKKEDADIVMCSYTKEFSDHLVINHIFEQSYFVWQENEVKSNFHRRLFGLINKELARPEEGDLIVSVCMQLFKSEMVKSVEFVDLKEIGTCEDGLFQIVVYQNCKKFVYIDKSYYHYRKTNEHSITTSYKTMLFEQWQKLFNIMKNIIDENNFDDSYSEALNNRIAISMLGLGLNEISATNKGVIKKSERLKDILKTEAYEKAYKELDFKYFPFKWKVFFYLCKFKMTLLLCLMLQIIEFLRKRVR